MLTKNPQGLKGSIKPPEPMRVIAVSSAIAGCGFWSRMAQLSTLGGIRVHMKRSLVIFSAVNLVVMLILVDFVLSARQQAIMEERDYYDFGDNLTFTMMIVPILWLCLIADIIWAVMALVAIFRHRSYQSAVACVIAAALWAAVIPLAREITSLPPNKSPEPTADGACSSAIAVHATSRRWLSFFR
jgi:heme/copper-type cytochrome/quinol oxidase subunit 2